MPLKWTDLVQEVIMMTWQFREFWVQQVVLGDRGFDFINGVNCNSLREKYLIVVMPGICMPLGVNITEEDTSRWRKGMYSSVTAISFVPVFPFQISEIYILGKFDPPWCLSYFE